MNPTAPAEPFTVPQFHRRGHRDGAVIGLGLQSRMAARTPCGPTSESGAPSVGPANMQPFNGIPNTLTRIDTPRERARTPPMPDTPANAGFTPTVPSADGEPTVETDHGERSDTPPTKST